MPKKITNFNAMRPAIVASHNDGNKKAISRDLVVGCDIDTAFFQEWKNDVRKLQKACYEYIKLKKNGRFNPDITEGEIYAARERIFPKWKEILSVGEAGIDTKELHVQESDVEDLVGFAWDFFATTRGTVEAGVSENIFRKKVEALLGCAIAKNMCLEDADRETLEKFYSAQRRVTTATDKLAELEANKKQFKELLDKTPESEETKAIRVFINNNLIATDEEIKKTKELKADAEVEVKKYGTEAKAIEAKIAKIPVK